VTFLRTLTLFAFAVWQGGFFFYAAVVVPTATRVLESASLQGSISQPVTHWLNLLGVAALVVFAIDHGRTPTLKTWRWTLWRVMAVCQIALFFLHPVLDANFRPDDLTYVDKPRFKFWHGIYLWVHAGQWLAGLAWLGASVKAWQTADATSPP
jgi:hypothetical protein